MSRALGLFAGALLRIQIFAPDGLEDELVAAAGEPDARADLQVEVLAGVIDDAVDLMRLVADGVELPYGAVFRVLLDCVRERLPVVGDAHRWREHEVLDAVVS